MLVRKLVKNVTRLALVLMTYLAMFVFPPVPVQAQEPINLVLGGEGSINWNINNIKPGDSGIKTVELHNPSSRNGLVIIWISDIVSSEGVNPESETGDLAESGELGEYLLFNILCSKLVS